MPILVPLIPERYSSSGPYWTPVHLVDLPSSFLLSHEAAQEILPPAVNDLLSERLCMISRPIRAEDVSLIDETAGTSMAGAVMK